ncbi:MAG: alpha/beta hydrolase [Halorientalis sp.]
MADQPHPQAQNILDIIEGQPFPPVNAMSVADAREQFEGATTLTDGPDVDDVRDIEMGGPGGALPARLYLPEGDPPHPVLVFFHGGGWVLGDVETHDNQCRHIVDEAGCAVFSVDYRRAPEATFPAALDDAYAATTWVADHGHHIHLDTDRMAIGGDSAGGNLAAATTLRIADEGGPELAHQVLAYPAVASPAVHDFPSYEENAEGYFLETEAMEWFVDCYVDDDRDLRNEYFAPLLARELSATPPATVLTAGFDPIRDEGVAYADHLEESGVDVNHYHYEDLIHGFLGMVDMVDPAADAVERVGEDLRAAFE